METGAFYRKESEELRLGTWGVKKVISAEVCAMGLDFKALWWLGSREQFWRVGMKVQLQEPGEGSEDTLRVIRL